MRILAINCGSSTLKFAVLDASAEESSVTHRAAGVVDRIGGDSIASLSVAGHAYELAKPTTDHAEAFGIAANMLQEEGALTDLEAVGHRVVHGGTRFREPVLIDDEVLDAIEVAAELAPLHNGPAIQVITAARAYFDPPMPMVATFDTAFYASLPDVAAHYAIPADLSERFGIRRFGFHGLAHRYMVERYRALRPDIPEPRLITLQLGNGCSATASKDGRPVDTSMGFTPLEGLIMGTRSGDLDPSIPLYLLDRQGISAHDVEEILNRRSGLLGLSRKSNDMRELLDVAKSGDEDSELAVRAFCYRAKKYVGAYLAALGGADALIFGGGIGEHVPEIREAVCRGLGWAGLELDPERNRAELPSDERISVDSGSIETWVVHVNETVIIAHDVMDCLEAAYSESD
jgi:acetate kinase